MKTSTKAWLAVGVPVGVLLLLATGFRQSTYLRKDTGAYFTVEEFGLIVGPAIELSRRELPNQTSLLLTTVQPRLQGVAAEVANAVILRQSFRGLAFDSPDGQPSWEYQLGRPLPFPDWALAMEFLAHKANRDAQFIPRLEDALARVDGVRFARFQEELRTEFKAWLLQNYPEAIIQYEVTVAPVP